MFLVFALTGIPQSVWATAIANSALAFSSLQITPGSGTLQLNNPWALIAFSEARNSLGELDQDFALGSSPGSVSVDSMVTWAEGHGTASAPNDPPDLNVTGAAASSVNIPGNITGAAESLGRGTLINDFMITGGTGPVNVDFSVNLAGLLRVLTDEFGVLAETEVIYGLELDGEKLLFFNDRLSIGSSLAITRPVNQSLAATKTLAFDTPYSLFLEIDSESRALNIPEPPTLALLLTSLGLFRLKHRRKTGVIPHSVSN
jgi:hypothetical protein